MDVKSLNLVELNVQEAREIDGGGWMWLAEQIIENWDDIKRGVSDGYNRR